MLNSRLLALVLMATTGLLASHSARAEDAWDPFNQLDHSQPKKKPPPKPEEPPRQPLASMDSRLSQPGTNNAATPQSLPGSYTPIETPGAVTREALPPPVDEASRGVQRGELAPVQAADGSGLPYELWRGLDVAALEGLIAKLEIPPRSAAVSSLWQRLITAKVTPPDGAGADSRFDLVRAEALYRSGLIEEAGKIIAGLSREALSNPTATMLAARIEVGLGQFEAGCARAKATITKKAELPKQLHSEALLIAGICAASKGNPAGAGLIADIAREEKVSDPSVIAALDAIASGQKTPARGLKSVSLLQYRAFSFAGGVDSAELVAHGEPALLAALAQDNLAQDKTTDPSVLVTAAEGAARSHTLVPERLAEIYRTHGVGAAAKPGASSRSALFVAAEAERTPLKKVRLIRSLLDDAKRAGLYLQTLEMLSKTTETIQPVPEIGWFAETGIEIALAKGDVARARQWATLGGSVPGDGGLRHWQGLTDIIDPGLTSDRGRNLGAIEELAARGRLNPDLLHRIATVLDANDINVPIPLWEAASRAPQPTGGFLPETGVLSALQDSSKKKEFGRTVLLVMRALGPTGAEGANMIALGDAIRALRRAGLESDARRLSFEALFAQWPRNATN